MASLEALAAGALAAVDIATVALRRGRRRADAYRMTSPRTATEYLIAQAREDLKPGALISVSAMAPAVRLVEVVDFTPGIAGSSLRCLMTARDDAEITVPLSWLIGPTGTYSVVRPPDAIPNQLSDADVELLRTRVDQRGT